MECSPLHVNTEGHSNVAVGYNSGCANTTGDGNTYVGREAGNGNTTADHNTAVGYFALKVATTGVATQQWVITL